MLKNNQNSNENEATKNKIPQMKVRSNIRIGFNCVNNCGDAWCQANCGPRSGGTCLCCDDGSHDCVHYII